MAAIRTPALVLFLANALGMGLFILVTSQLFWIEPELAYDPGASGGAAFGWIVFAAPIGLLFVIADICWLAVALRGRARSNRIAAVALTAILLGFWIAAYVVDNMHHGV